MHHYANATASRAINRTHGEASGLFCKKWGSKTYGQRTFARAIDGKHQVFTPHDAAVPMPQTPPKNVERQRLVGYCLTGSGARSDIARLKRTRMLMVVELNEGAQG